MEVMRPLIWLLRPSMMAATEITDVTPMTMPRTVRAERALRERRVSSATEKFSYTSSSRTMLFRPQCDHRIEPAARIAG